MKTRPEQQKKNANKVTDIGYRVPAGRPRRDQVPTKSPLPTALQQRQLYSRRPSRPEVTAATLTVCCTVHHASPCTTATSTTARPELMTASRTSARSCPKPGQHRGPRRQLLRPVQQVAVRRTGAAHRPEQA